MNTIIQNYYASLNAKDDKWQEMWAEDADFSDASGTLHAKGNEAVIKSFTPFLKGVAGVSIKQIIAEGNNACVIASYEYINPKGQTLSQDVAEIWEIKNGKLAKLTIYFDLTAYRNFMKS